MSFKISGVEVPRVPLKTTDIGDRGTYQLQSTDEENYLVYLGTTFLTFTVPPNSTTAFSDGTEISIEQSNTGQITFVGGNGVTITSRAELRTSNKGSVVKLKRLSIDNWILYGDVMDNTGMAMIIAMS